MDNRTWVFVMRKILIAILLCLFLTSRGNFDDEEKNADDIVAADGGINMNDETKYVPTEGLSHVMGKLIEEQDDYCILQVVGDGFDGISGKFFMKVDSSIFQGSKTAWAVVEYSGSVKIADNNDKAERLPEECYTLLTDEFSFFMVPEKTERAIWVDNNGVVKGTVVSLETVLDDNDEVTDGYNSIRPAAEEYEGNEVLMGYFVSKAETNSGITLNSTVTVYYDPDTFEISKVEVVTEK